MNDTSNPITVMIADDHQLFVEGLSALFAAENKIKLIGRVQSGEELLLKVSDLKPGVVILDIKMLGMSGIKVLQILKVKYKSIKVIMLSTYSDEETIKSCLESGADGYLFKNASIEELRNAIIGVTCQIKFFPPLEVFQPSQEATFKFYAKSFKITPKEMEILQLIKQGYSNQKISEQLSRSIFTVETHRKNIMQKLNLHSPSALYKFLLEGEVK